MALLRYGSASVTQPSVTAECWVDKVYSKVCSDGRCRMKTAKSVLAKYDPKRYLLSHCTIVAAVDTDLADPKDSKSDYLIKPEYSKLVNNNGDAWTKRMLEASYKTFIGADNYLEHVQVAELSKGKVIDAVLREVPIGKDVKGNDVTTYYVDILVATDRKHDDLVRKIEANTLSTMSMGCKISFSICSKCGNKAIDESQACQHVRYEKGNTFYDTNGTPRKVAELCGHYSEPDSVVFVDASWVANPAFTGAVLRNTIIPTSDIQAKIEAANSGDHYKVQAEDILKVANKLAADPVDDTPPADAPAEDAPADETPTDAPADPATDAPADPATDAPADPAQDPAGGDTGGDPSMDAPVEESSPQNDAKTWRDSIKKKILDQIGDEIVKDLSNDEDGLQAPRELETLDDTLIHQASVALKKVWGSKKAWDDYLKKTAGNLDAASFKKLRIGTQVLMTSNDPRDLRDIGFNKRDFLAVLSYLDNQCKNPLPVSIKKIVAEMGGTAGFTPIQALSHVVTKVGRKITASEGRKSLVWLRLLDHYDSK